MQEVLTALFYSRKRRDPQNGEMVEYMDQWWEWDSALHKWFIVSETSQQQGPIEQQLRELKHTIIIAFAIIAAIMLVLTAGTCMNVTTLIEREATETRTTLKGER